MSIAYLAYHKAWERGPFSGDNFYTDKNIPVGAMCFVVSGNKPQPSGGVSYKLEGKYHVEEVNSKSSGGHNGKDHHLVDCNKETGSDSPRETVLPK